MSRSVANFRGISRSSYGALGGQRWTTNNFYRPTNYARTNFTRTNLSNTNFSRTNFRTYQSFNRGTLSTTNNTLRNNSILRSNNLGFNRNSQHLANAGLANNRRWNGNGNGNWDHHHHHHHDGSSVIFIGGFGYPWYYGSSFYDYYPYGYYPYGYGYGDYGYGYGTYPAASYYYSGGAYDGGVYQGGDPGSYQDDSNYQDDQSGGSTYSDGGDSSVAEVQRVLSREGFYHGPIDGVAGSRTYYAIRAYERSHNLRADGQISRELLESMGLH